MLDAFGSDNPDDYIAGFPEHPHRGFETVTYMIEGSIAHRRQSRRQGLGHGWRRAVDDRGPRRGAFRNAGADRTAACSASSCGSTCRPKRRCARPGMPTFRRAPFRRFDVGGAAVKLIAGEWNGRKGPGSGADNRAVHRRCDACAERERVDIPLTEGHSGFVYVFEGAVRAGGETIRAGKIGVLSDGGALGGLRRRRRARAFWLSRANRCASPSQNTAPS